MDVNALPFVFPGLDNVGCAFQIRTGAARSHAAHIGEMDGGNISLDVGDDPRRVVQARRGLCDMLEVDAWCELKQVHGAQMVFEPEPGDISAAGEIEADGSACAEAGKLLVMKTADCQPILLAHRGGRHIAALHVGWRGNVQNFPRLGVKAFCDEYGLDPKDVMAVRGPSLGPGQSEFTNFEQEFGSHFQPFYREKDKTVDLWSLTREQLKAAGLQPAHIFSLDLCTFSLPDLFFSYRRKNVCGRQASVIWLKS